MEVIAAGLLVALIAPFVMLFGMAIMAVIYLLLAYPLMLAWNYVIPAVFQLTAITYWQAYALLIVAALLIKSSSTNNNSSK